MTAERAWAASWARTTGIVMVICTPCEPEADGVPPGYVWLVEYLLATVFDGRNEYVAYGVRRALGREPRDFATYAGTRPGPASGGAEPTGPR